jgi:hypothetical protein
VVAPQLVLRARIVLLAAQGVTDVSIAAWLDVDVDTASEWLVGLTDRPRSGRPRRFAAGVVAEVKAMACEPPQARAPVESPRSLRWSSRS